MYVCIYMYYIATVISYLRCKNDDFMAYYELLMGVKLVYLGTYILPGGLATSRAIAPFEAEAIECHPYIRDAFGDNYQWEVCT